ncbi:MAG: outer membrane beta-barrel protein [Bacteroidales bacterium]|nr:outer membrane beta-barrel protein [Bacteroidales bacterium]MDZ4203995.1 outer membrane beta-barrel protein [Bacteroidales bacterium]
MKIIYYAKRLAIFMVVALLSISALAQEQSKPTKSSFIPRWYLGAGTGFSQYLGDLNDNNFFQIPTEWREAGNLMVGRQFSPLFGLRAQGQWVGIFGESDDYKQYTRGELFDFNLSGTLSILNLVKLDPARKFDLYGIAGIGQAQTRTRLRHGPAPDGIWIANYGYDGKGIDKRATTLVVPFGIGAKFSITKNLDFNFEIVPRWTNTDELDAKIVSGSGNDYYVPTTLGLVYNFDKCENLSKMVKEFDKITYTVTPEVLENNCGSVKVNVVGKVPPEYFLKKAAITYEPVLKYATGETRLKPITLIGEKVVGDGVKINYQNGGTFNYSTVIPYKPEMSFSDLVVDPLIYAPKTPVSDAATYASVIATEKYYEVPQVYLAPGVINTGSGIADVLHDEVVLSAEHGYQKETIITKEATIYFVVDMHNLNWNLALNKNAEAKNKLKELEVFLRLGYKLRDIDISAWASPEGEESRNQGLSERRSQTGLKYTKDLLKKLVRDKKNPLKIANIDTDIKYNVKALGEDWNGFMKAVQASNIPDKNIIANVVNSQTDLKKRELEIRKMTLVYKEIEVNILPPLRRVVITANAFEPKKTDGEMANLATSAPDKLSVQELLYAATLTDDAKVKLRIYESAMKLYPTSYAAFNNAAAIEIQNGNLTKASEYLEKAQDLGAGKPEVLNNLGVIELKNGNVDKAVVFFTDAKKAGANVDYNTALTQIAKCDYKNAATLLGTKTCNHNVALVQMLNGNLSGASQNAKCAPENAKTFYLAAVIAARMNDNQGVISNLTKAIAADASLKAVAAKDREFYKLVELPAFQALVK